MLPPAPTPCTAYACVTALTHRLASLLPPNTCKLLCSISPISKAPPDLTKNSWFDQVDDDFKVEPGQPNTRTVWRPGARFGLRVLSLLATQHVYTAAQGTYTANIMAEVERAPCVARGLCAALPFTTVLHRDLVPHHDHHATPGVARGKDVRRIVGANGEALSRVILYDDRVSNHEPQPRNGVHVRPFLVSDVEFGGDVEFLRLTGIALLAFFAPDVRPVLAWFRTARLEELVAADTATAAAATTAVDVKVKERDERRGENTKHTVK